MSDTAVKMDAGADSTLHKGSTQQIALQNSLHIKAKRNAASTRERISSKDLASISSVVV